MKTILFIIQTILTVIFIIPPQSVSGKMFFIAVSNYMFTPDNITDVRVGDTVRWVWEGGSHTTTSTTIPIGAVAWDHPIDASNASYDYIPMVAGVYNYKCTPHASMGMVGSFTVLSPTGIGDHAGISSLTVFPNPFVDRVSLRFEATGSFELRLSVMDITGKKILESTVQVEPGIVQKDIDLKNIGPGIFFIEVTSPSGESITRRILRI